MVDRRALADGPTSLGIPPRDSVNNKIPRRRGLRNYLFVIEKSAGTSLAGSMAGEAGMIARPHSRLVHLNRVLICVLTLAGLLMDGFQISDLPCAIAVHASLWLPH